MNTAKGYKMDIARFLVRVPIAFKLKESYSVAIDDKEFQVVLWEELFNFGKEVIISDLKMNGSVASFESESVWFESFSAGHGDIGREESSILDDSISKFSSLNRDANIENNIITKEDAENILKHDFKGV